MSRNGTLETALCLGLFTLTCGGPALAQDWQTDASTLHVVEPLRVPGAVLEPGTYRIRVVDEQSDRNIVQVTDVDERTVYATMIATPHVARRGRPDTEFVYDKDADGNPMALRSWWAPNDPYGQDLVYTPAENAELARLAERIPASHGSRVAFARNASGPAASSPAVPAVKSEKPAAVVAAAAPAPKMPRTASPMPLVALAGLTALGGAAALRITARRDSAPGFTEP
jgi:hypothetical protein